MQLSLMKVAVVMALAVGASAQANQKSMAETSHNPVVRVVEMLKGLSKKLEADQKTELGLYQDFECWAKRVIEGKEASNKDAESKIEELKQEIADLESGATTLTSEKNDLEAEIVEDNRDITDTNNTRKINHKGFLLAEEEMVMGIAALKKAIAVLKDATKDYQGNHVGKMEMCPMPDLQAGLAKMSANCSAEMNAQLTSILTGASKPQDFGLRQACSCVLEVDEDFYEDKKQCLLYPGAPASVHAIYMACKTGNVPAHWGFMQTNFQTAPAEKDGALLTVRSEVRSGVDEDISEGGMASLEYQSALTKKAIEIGKRVLHKADATFLQRLLTGQVPKVDWKKLNRKATFRMSYKARSGGIQEQLYKMLIAFNTTLREARAKEVNETLTYEQLIEIKINELLNDEDALDDLAAETAAKEKRKQDCEAEIADLEKQIQDALDFIKDTNLAVAAKYNEYRQRKALRMGELEAISKAISILYSDDARDLMKKSYSSQGYFFIQESAHQSEVARFNKAAGTLRKLAAVTKDRRVLEPNGPLIEQKMGKAVEAINELIEKLKGEEAEDLKEKEKCEKERAEDTREAIQFSRQIDDSTDKMSEMNDTIAELVAKIAATEADIAADQASKVDMKKQRDKEHEKYVADNADDVAAVQLVEQATAVLKEFYESNHLMLVQERQVGRVARKEAPPDTPEGGYMGAMNEANAIFAALDNLKKDIEGDLAKAKKEEDEAAAEYTKLDQKLDQAILDGQATVEELKGLKGAEETAKKTELENRDDILVPELESVKELIMKKVGTGCDYFLVNYKLRLSNRQVEIDGLYNAKLYLQGGQLTQIDPNRALVPGDAAVFAQRKAVQLHH